MRRLFAAIVASLACMAGLVSVPANAAPAVSQSAEGLCYPTLQSGCQVAPYSIYNQYKFWPYDPAWVCVANGDNGIPIGQAAQAWNNASAGLYLDYSSNCVTDGYTPSTRMTIDTYNAVDGVCVKFTNMTYALGSDGFRRYTNNPVGWVNMNPTQGCGSTAFRRAHWTSVAIGFIAGLTLHHDNTTTWDSRVMAYRTQDTVAWPPASTDGPSMTGLYTGDYVGAG